MVTCKIEHTLCWMWPKEALFWLDLQQRPAIQSSNGPHLASHKTNTQARDNPDLWHPSWTIIIMTMPLQQLSKHTTHLFMTSPLPSIKPPQHFPTRRAIILYNGCCPEHHHNFFYIFLPATQNNTTNPRWPLTIACFHTHTHIQIILYCHVVCTKRKDTENK